MESELEDGIKLLVGALSERVDSADALRYTQAALNLAHVRAVLAQTTSNSTHERQVIRCLKANQEAAEMLTA